MAATTTTTYSVVRSTVGASRAYGLLYFCYFLVPAVAGIDKFFNYLTNWQQYIAPQIFNYIKISPQMFMQIVGVVEMAAAVLVLISPRVGGVVVGLWLWAIICNLIPGQGNWDIALRDLGLSLGAFALAALASDRVRRPVS